MKNITEQDILDTWHLSLRAAGRQLGCSKANIEKRRARLVKRGVWKGEQTHLVPEGYQVKGKSVLFDAAGNPVMSWVKSDIDAEARERMMQAVLDAMKEELPRAAAVPPDYIERSANLCNLFVLSDFHLGMKAWAEETGDADWDVNKAEELLIRWLDVALANCPESRTAIFAQLGDFLHWDGLEAVTPTNRHILDADTRFQKVARVAIKITRYVIRRLLDRHDHVKLIQVGGNHDPASTVWLREFFFVHYEDEPRVTVDRGAGLYFAHEHGDTSLFFHHGHKRNGSNIENTIISNFRDIFGRTKYSYIHTGHYHHYKASESVMITEQHRTLAPKDTYAAQGGWVSGRDAKVITYHSEYGEVSRISVTPEMCKR